MSWTSALLAALCVGLVAVSGGHASAPAPACVGGGPGCLKEGPPPPRAPDTGSAATVRSVHVVDPVRQELEETGPASGPGGAAPPAPTPPPHAAPAAATTAATTSPATLAANKVALEFTNHVSILYNETGMEPPAVGLRKDLVVENGSKLSYAIAFLHSKELNSDEESQITTLPPREQSAIPENHQEKVNISEPLTREQHTGSPDDIKSTIGAKISSTFNRTNPPALSSHRDEQTQSPFNTVRPNPDKDVQALKDLKAGGYFLRTTQEPVASSNDVLLHLNHDDKQERSDKLIQTTADPLKFDSTDNKTVQALPLEASLKDQTSDEQNNKTEKSASIEHMKSESRLTEESTEHHILVANSKPHLVSFTTPKVKGMSKDEELRNKSKLSLDTAPRNKKLIKMNENSSNPWAKILSLSTITTQELNASYTQTTEAYVLKEEPMNIISNLSEKQLLVSGNTTSVDDDEDRLVPVEISTVVPPTTTDNRRNRITLLRLETLAPNKTDIKNTTAMPLKPNMFDDCETNTSCKTAKESDEENMVPIKLSTTTSVPETTTFVGTTHAPVIITDSGPWTVAGERETKPTEWFLEDVITTTDTQEKTYYSSDQPTTDATTVPKEGDRQVSESKPTSVVTDDSPAFIEDGDQMQVEKQHDGAVTELPESMRHDLGMSTTEEQAQESTTAPPTPPLEVGSDQVIDEGDEEWQQQEAQLSDQPQAGSDDITTTSKMIVYTTTMQPETTTNSPNTEPDPNEYDIPDKTTTVDTYCQLTLLASGEQVCRHEGELRSNIASLLQRYTKRIILSHQVVIIMLGHPVHCDEITQEHVLNVYIQDEKGTFDRDLCIALKRIWDTNHPPLPLQVLRMQLIVDGSNSTEDYPIYPDTDVDQEVTSEGITPGLLAAIVVACIGTLSLFLLFCLMVYVRRRQKRFNYGQRCTPVSLDAYSVDSISVYDSVRSRRKGVHRASKRSYGNPAFDDPNAPTHPMNFAGLANFSSDLDALREEFEAIPQVTVTTDELPDGADLKNRYSNVIPLPETRVHLTLKEGDPLSDYINANYVRGPKGEEKFYIACQAPLQSTITDFWQMIWEQQTKVILMLTNLVENGSEKCADYLPPSEVLDCHRLFGDFQITLKKREEKEKYIISTLQIKNLETNLWREVTHMWFASWPEQGVPEDPSPLIAFLIEARPHMRGAPGPHVVHCSPGTGRTGTVIACDILIREFEQTRNVDVPRCVYRLRRDRAGAVKTKEQYVYIYKVLNHYATMLTGGALDSI